MPYKDPEKKKAWQTRWRKANPEKQKALNAAWDATHREERRVASAARRAAYPIAMKVAMKASNAAWSIANPESHALSKARRRARKAGLPSTLTHAEWEAIKTVYRHRCAYCGKRQKRLTQDHVVPIIKGGGTTRENIVPACKSCNSKKSTKLPTKPVKLVLL